MNQLLEWLGWGSSVLNATFWKLPLTLFCTGSILFTSLIRVLHTKYNQSFVDVVWHFLFGTVAGAGFFIGLTEDRAYSHHIIQILLLLIAIRGILKTLLVIKPVQR